MKNFARLLSVLLCLTMLFSLSSTAFAAQKEAPLRLTVTTDTHYKSFADAEPLDNNPENQTYIKGLLNPTLYGYASTQGQMDYESKAICKKMLAQFAASDSDFLLISGDLTCGKRQSHLEFAELLRQTEQKSGKQIFVTCGNHDCDPDDEGYIDIDEFKKIYADFGWDKALEADDDSACYTADLNDSVRLLAVDSCIYGKDDGEIDDARMAWIDSQVQAAKKDGKTLIAMMHHSILPHFEVQPMMKNYRKTAEKFADRNISYVLTGHIHANDISSSVSPKGNPITDIQTGSLTTSPNAYRTITIANGKMDIARETVSSIDLSDLPDGYSEEQLAKMKADFPTYAADYFESGVCRWINRNIGSAGKIGKKLKLDTESALYKGLDDLLLCVGDALHMPIYDDGQTPDTVDSLEEIAALNGYTIPQSDYERLYQVMAAFMHGFYCGDESATLKTVELPLLLSCFKAALARSFYSIGLSSKVEKLAKDVLGVETNLALRVLSGNLYRKTLVNRLVDAVLVPLTNGLSADLSAPSDITCTLTFGETIQGGIPMRFWDQLIAFLRAMFGR